jgi:hypothetical protein
MDSQVHVLIATRPSDILRAHAIEAEGAGVRNAGQEDCELLDKPTRRYSIDNSMSKHFLCGRRLDVDKRRFGRDRNRFFDASEAQFRIHRRGEGACQFDPFAFGDVETLQREGDRVDPRPKGFYSVLTGCIADNRTRFLDEGGARGFDRHAW